MPDLLPIHLIENLSENYQIDQALFIDLLEELQALGYLNPKDGAKKVENTQRSLALTRECDIFDDCWQCWPNKKAKKNARNAWNRLTRGWSDSRVRLFANQVKNDIQRRLSLSQLGFDAMMFSTYLNNERWTDDYQAPQPKHGTNGLSQALAVLRAS